MKKKKWSKKESSGKWLTDVSTKLYESLPNSTQNCRIKVTKNPPKEKGINLDHFPLFF